MKYLYVFIVLIFIGCAVTPLIVSNPTSIDSNENAKDSTELAHLITDSLHVELDSVSIVHPWGDYYGAYTKLRGAALKQHLHKIIRNHRVINYQEVWEAIEFTDLCDSIASNVILIYSMRSQAKFFRDRGTSYPYAENGYSLIDSWNREHVWPKSHGFPNEKDTAYTDLHHLRAADRSINSARNTRSFDYSDEIYYDNGGTIPTRCKTSKSKYSWEPPDAVKGDIARMMFYMAVRYEGPSYDLELVDYVVPNNNKLPILGKLSTLLEWHKLDPVDQRERNRNQIIYLNYQGNRNPFIDHPEFVDLIWK